MGIIFLGTQQPKKKSGKVNKIGRENTLRVHITNKSGLDLKNHVHLYFV